VGTIIQPGITVIRDLSKLDERGCRGAPDWIIEMLSPPPPPPLRIRSRNVHSTSTTVFGNIGWSTPTEQVLFVYWL